MDENTDMRNMLLSELIDNMHSRLADKMFPPELKLEETPASGETIVDASATNEVAIPTKDMGEHGDDKGDDTGIPMDEPSDEEIEEMLK